MTRLRGRAPRGQRALGTCPAARWQTTTMMASLRLDGSTACMALEGSTDIQSFSTYIQAVLVPQLQAGDIVVMDNLAAHKAECIQRLVSAAGAQVLYLPAYSPDLNPIEMMWSKVKNLLRSLEARNPEELITAIGQALARVTSRDAINWFAHCGYSFC